MSTLTVKFLCEPADRSVGIMSEGFSAWVKDGLNANPTCMLVDITSGQERFEWFDEDDEPCSRPFYAAMVEQALVGFANGYYDSQFETYGE